MADYEILKIVRWIFLGSGYISLILAMIFVVYFGYYYLPKFELENALEYDGYRSLYRRGIHLGLLCYLSVATPGTGYYEHLERCAKKACCEAYLQIEHEKLKPFRIAFWILIVDVFFVIFAYMLLKTFPL